MTRVYVSGEGYVLRVPECWTYWRYCKVSYRRHEGIVEEQTAGRWVPALIGESFTVNGK